MEMGLRPELTLFWRTCKLKVSRFYNQDADIRSSLYYVASKLIIRLGKISSDVSPVVSHWIEQHQNAENAGWVIDVLWDLVAREDNWG